jgi:intracellular septation protein A
LSLLPYFLSELPATAFTPAVATSTVVPTTAAPTLTVVATTVTAASATVTTAQPLQRMQIRMYRRQTRVGGIGQMWLQNGYIKLSKGKLAANYLIKSHTLPASADYQIFFKSHFTQYSAYETLHLREESWFNFFYATTA